MSPSGKKIAVASFQKKSGWDGEIQDLRTDIFVMNVDKPFKRQLVVDNGGWPTWGSEDVIFFHRKEGDNWGVFQFDITNKILIRVTPIKYNAMTPAAIDSTTVAVAIIPSKNLPQFGVDRKVYQHRHIVIYKILHDTKRITNTAITPRRKPLADHFNPFVIIDGEEKRIGYHRVNTSLLQVTANFY